MIALSRSEAFQHQLAAHAVALHHRVGALQVRGIDAAEQAMERDPTA